MSTSLPVSFKVYGDPKPQGSKKVFMVKGKPVVTEAAGKPLKDWRSKVRNAAETVWPGPLVDEPVTVTVVFNLPRPKTTKYPDRPAGRPDLDKLVRGVLDGITGSIITDDSRVVTVCAEKHWATQIVPAGALVVVEPV